MLPSTGYFKAINCPFYDSGLCERPYCHFKHPRREDGAAAAVLPVQSVASNEGERASVGQQNSNTLQELVSQAVKKVLAGHEGGETGEISQNIVSRVVEELNPTLTSASSSEILIAQPPAKPTPCVYNPTPIAELKKRHIPVVAYMPTRESKVAVKRKSSPDRFKPWLSLPQDICSSLDKAAAAPSYSTVKVSEITYKPTAISNSLGDSGFVQSYVPTIKSDSSSPNSYHEDGNSSDYLFKAKEEYRPRSKKRREEYVPKKLKAPLNAVRQLDEPVSEQFPTTGADNRVQDVSKPEKDDSGLLEAQVPQSYEMGIEPQFSDEEEQYKTRDDSSKEADKMVTDPAAPAADKSEEKSKGGHKSGSKSKDNGEGTKAAERRSSLSKDREKPKEKTDKDKSRKERRSSGTNEREKDLKDVGNRERSKEKDKHRRSSSSKDKRHSSSSEKGKSRRSSKESGDSKRSDRGSDKKGRDSSSSSKEKDRNVRGKSEERRKSGSRDDKQKSKSSSSSSRDKHPSNKTERKLSRSSSKSTSSSKKSEARKKSNAEASGTEDHDEKENSPSLRFRSASPYSEEILEISDSDHDIEEECLKIFQEYEVSEHPKEPTIKDRPRRESHEVEDSGKKRVAHASASQYSEPKRAPSQPAKVPVDPQKKLIERWRLRREAIAEKVAAVTTSQGNSTAQSSQQQQQQQQQQNSSNSAVKSDQLLNGNGRLRIAHVPYATSLALAKKKVSEVMSKNLENKTIAQTAKGGSRVAHVPQVIPQLIRSEPLQVATQKFPLNVRQYYVNMMQDICIQIYTNGEDAAQRALREEFACHERCKAVAVYKNSCMLATHRLRKELDQRSSNETGSSTASGTVSHEAVLAGKSKGSWSVVRTKRSVTEFKGATLYAMLTKWIMTEEQLRENGFPRPHPDGPTGRVKIYVTNTRNQTIISKVPNERFCSRCNQPYMVDKHGNAVVQQNCIYHWGRKFTIRGEGRYSCCQQYGSATGCCDAKTHVWDHVDYENLRGYVKTLPKDNIAVEEQGAYALDCEMSYTTQGLELTRITVINEDCNVVYETLVKPDHPVIDYNTRFSGITEKNMEGVTTTLLDVQATLLSMFSDKTILIGHSLESDFKALKLVHDTVVDTSIMFPHRNGYPQKRALRNLCSEYLQKIIQNDVSGHDSNEDAVSCMELVIWKLKEEAKSQ